MSRAMGMVIAAAIVVAGLLLGVQATRPLAAAGPPPLPTGTLRVAPDATPAERAAVVSAVAAARPEARRLLEAVDGAVEVRVAPPAGGAVGLMETTPGGYRVTLDLATVTARYGQRGVSRLVLHELAHVVDHALVPPDLARQLDEATPRGWAATGPASGSSATREERFAESFAKWATGDIGVDLYLGYAVPPPPVDWGAPLAAVLE